MSAVDPIAILALVAALTLAYNQFRLTRENRRKVLAEGSREEAQGADLITQGAGRLVERWEAENRRLRERLEQLEDSEERMEARLRSCHRRIDQLEGLLRAHGVTVPATE